MATPATMATPASMTATTCATTPTTPSNAHQRLDITQNISWTNDLESERIFLQHKANTARHPNHLGPIIAKRLEWLRIPIKCLTSTPDPSATTTPINSPSDSNAASASPTLLTDAVFPAAGASTALGSSTTASPTSPTLTWAAAAPAAPMASTNQRSSPSNRQSNPRNRGSDPSTTSQQQSPSQSRLQRAKSAPQLAPAQQPRVSLTVFAGRRECGLPYKRGGVGNNPKTRRSQPHRPLKAGAVDESFLLDLPERVSRSLVSLELPVDDVQNLAVQALRHELETANSAFGTAAAVSLTGIAHTYHAFLLTARSRQGRDEAALTAAWCRVCNHAWVFLRDYLAFHSRHSDGPDNSDRWSPSSVVCRSDAEHVLFHDTSTRSTVPDANITFDETRPDIQCLYEAKVRLPPGQASNDAQDAVQWTSSADSSARIAMASQELKASASDDLSSRLTGQVLRNMFRCFQHQEGLHRASHLTVTGSRVHLWMGDASSLSTSRAYDALERNDALGIAQILAFMCSTAQHAAPAWQPFTGMILHCDYPAVYDASGKVLCFSQREKRYFRIVGEVQFMQMPQTRLWGRHTACWSAQAEEVEPGPAHGQWVAVASSPGKIPIVLKAGWLPEYLRKHEYEMLRIVHRGEVEHRPLPDQDDFPWALGIVDLSELPVPQPIPTVRLPHIPRSQANSLEVDYQTSFVVLAQKCDVGLSVVDTPAPLGPSGWTLAQHARILRDLLRLLKRVSEKGIHYRDINLGNFALKPDFMHLLSSAPQRSILMLFDFGSSRYLDQHRGGGDHPRARNIALGVDDALSVNANFLSHRTLLCMQLLEKAAQLHARATDSNGGRARAEKKFLKAQRLEHRYVDDCESALWAYLHLLQAWCNSWGCWDAFEYLFTEVQTPQGRRYIWQAEWADEMHKLAQHLPEHERDAWLALLEELNTIIWTSQKQLHRPSLWSKLRALWGLPPTLLRGPLSQGEMKCFDACDRSLDALVRQAQAGAEPRAVHPPVPPGEEIA